MQQPHRKIIVISDNARPHTAKLVKEFEISNKKRFAHYNIPSYSPDVNPDEHVWGYLKGYLLLTHQAQNTKELNQLVKRKMRIIERKPELIKSFFRKKYAL